MGAGRFLCRDVRLLGETFRVHASYMPDSVAGTIDQYTRSAQWLRRFIGLKLFLSLATFGVDRDRRQMEKILLLSEHLKHRLIQAGWPLVNGNPVAVLCIVDEDRALDLGKIANAIVRTGRYWISTAMFEGQTVLRACIASHFTTETHLDGLVDELNAFRAGHGI